MLWENTCLQLQFYISLLEWKQCQFTCSHLVWEPYFLYKFYCKFVTDAFVSIMQPHILWLEGPSPRKLVATFSCLNLFALAFVLIAWTMATPPGRAPSSADCFPSFVHSSLFFYLDFLLCCAYSALSCTFWLSRFFRLYTQSIIRSLVGSWCCL
jgi:hypothetical protein